MQIVRRVFLLIDGLSSWSGKLVSMLIFPMVVVLTYEVISRYVFDRPTIWAHETTRYIYGFHFLLGGAYTLFLGSHVNVDIFYVRFSPRTKAIVNVFTYILFFLFAGVLLWLGIGMAWQSILLGESSPTPWHSPYAPLKIAVPLAALLILLQGLVRYVQNIFTAVTGKEFK